MPKIKDANTKPRGRMTAYAFFVQTCREEHKRKHPEENVVFAEFSRKCAERWKTMSEKEKKRFQDMADRDKKRYDVEMSSYSAPPGAGKGRKKKKTKDPNAPKRSLSAFFCFCQDNRSKIKEANPEFGIGDVAKELGKMWAEISAESKKYYEGRSEKDKARYEKEMTAYKSRGQAEAVGGDDEEEYEDDEDE